MTRMLTQQVLLNKFLFRNPHRWWPRMPMRIYQQHSPGTWQVSWRYIIEHVSAAQSWHVHP